MFLKAKIAVHCSEILDSKAFTVVRNKADDSFEWISQWREIFQRPRKQKGL